MLRQRILTATVLLAVIAAALSAASPWPFLALLSVAAGCALWEWLRLTASAGPAAALAGAALAALTLVQGHLWTGASDPGTALASYGLAMRVLLPLVCAAWLLGGPALLVFGRIGAPARSPVLSLAALPALYCTWAALALLFLGRGAVFVVSLLALVWVADIAAYFVGRAIGRRKLAPRISPGKSVEGAVAGIAAAVAWVMLSAQWPGSYGHALVAAWGGALAAALAALLGAVSIVGDLFESMLKRRAGRKDSSNLLPGHGGVLDRIDAVLPVAPLGLLLVGVAF